MFWVASITVLALVSNTLAELSKVDGIYPGEELEVDLSERQGQDLDFVLPYMSTQWPANVTIKPLGFVTWPLRSNEQCFSNDGKVTEFLVPKDVLAFVDGTFRSPKHFHYTAAFYYWTDNYTIVMRSTLNPLNSDSDLTNPGFSVTEDVVFDINDPDTGNVTFYQVISTLASFETDYLEEVVIYKNGSIGLVMQQILVEDEREPVREPVHNQAFWQGYEEFLAQENTDSNQQPRGYFRKINLKSELGVHLWYLPQEWKDPGLILLMSPQEAEVCNQSPCLEEQHLNVSTVFPGQTIQHVFIDEHVLNSEFGPFENEFSYLLMHVIRGVNSELYSVCLLQIPLEEGDLLCLDVIDSVPPSFAPFISSVKPKPVDQDMVSLGIGLRLRPWQHGKARQETPPTEAMNFVLNLNVTKNADHQLQFSMAIDTTQTVTNATDKLLQTLRQLDIDSREVPHGYESRARFGPRIALITSDARDYFYEALVPNGGSTFIYNTPVGGSSSQRRKFVFMSTSVLGKVVALDSALCWSGFYKGSAGLSFRFGSADFKIGEPNHEAIVALPMLYTYNPEEPGTYRRDQMIFEVGFLATKLEVQSRKPDGSDVAPPSGSKTRAAGGINTVIERNPSLLNLEWDSVTGPLTFLEVPESVRIPLVHTNGSLDFRRFSWMTLSYRYLSESGLGSRITKLPWETSGAEKLGILVKTGEELVDFATFRMYTCREMGWRRTKATPSENWDDHTTELCKLCSLKLNLLNPAKSNITLGDNFVYEQLATASSSTHIGSLMLKGVQVDKQTSQKPATYKWSLIHIAVSRINGANMMAEYSISDVPMPDASKLIGTTQILLTSSYVAFLYLQNQTLMLVLSSLQFNSPRPTTPTRKNLSGSLSLTTFHAIVFNPDPASIEVDVVAYSLMGRHEYFAQKAGQGKPLQVVSAGFKNFIIGSRWCLSGRVTKVCRTSNNLVILTENNALVIEPNGGQATRIYPNLTAIDLLCYDQERVLALVSFRRRNKEGKTTEVYSFMELVDSEKMTRDRENSVRLIPFSEIVRDNNSTGLNFTTGNLKLVQALSRGVYFLSNSGFHFLEMVSDPIVADYKLDDAKEANNQSPREHSIRHNLYNALTGEHVQIEQLLSLQYISDDKRQTTFTRKGDGDSHALPAKFERQNLNSYDKWNMVIPIAYNSWFKGHLLSVKLDTKWVTDQKIVNSFNETLRFVPKYLSMLAPGQQQPPVCSGTTSNGIWTACLSESNYTIDFYYWNSSLQAADISADVRLSVKHKQIPIRIPSADGTQTEQKIDGLALVDLWNQRYSDEFEAIGVLFTTTNMDSQISSSDRIYSKTVWLLYTNITQHARISRDDIPEVIDDSSARIICKDSDPKSVDAKNQPMQNCTFLSWSTSIVQKNLSLPVLPSSFRYARHKQTRYLSASLQWRYRTSLLAVKASNCDERLLVNEPAVQFYTMFGLRNNSQVWVVFGKTTVTDILYVRIFEVVGECVGESREIAIPFRGEGISAVDCVQSLAVEEKVHCVLAGVASSYWIEIYALYDRDPIILKYTEYYGYLNLVPSQVLMYVDDRATAKKESFFVLIGSRTIMNLTSNPGNEDDPSGYDSSVVLYFPRDPAAQGYAQGGMGVFEMTQVNLPEICQFSVAATESKKFLLFVRSCGESGNWEIGEQMKPAVVSSKRPELFEISTNPRLSGSGLGLDVAKSLTKVKGRVFGSSLKSDILLNPDPVRLTFFEENKTKIVFSLLGLLALLALYGLYLLRKTRLENKKRVLEKYKNFEKSDSSQREDDDGMDISAEYPGDLITRTRTNRTNTTGAYQPNKKRY